MSQIIWYTVSYGDVVLLVLSIALVLTLVIWSKTASGSLYEVRRVGTGSNNHLLLYKYQNHYDGIVVKSELYICPMTNQMKVACSSLLGLTENCPGTSQKFHEPTTASECLNSSGDWENIHGQCYSTKPAASVHIIWHYAIWFEWLLHWCTDRYRQFTSGGLPMPFEKNIAEPIQGIVSLDT